MAGERHDRPAVPGLAHPGPALPVDSGGNPWPISRHDVDKYVASLGAAGAR